jgi:hypothetical protein
MPKIVTREHTQPADTTEFFSADGAALGAIVSFRRLGQTIHVVQVTDWDGEAADGPLTVLVTNDWTEGETLVREHWQEHLRATGQGADVPRRLPAFPHG